MRRWAVCVRIAPRTRCLRSSPGRAAVLYTAGSPFESGRRLSVHALAVPESGRFLGREEGAGANPAEGSTRM
jgi:hypothetical protein